MFSINKLIGIVPNASEHGPLIDHFLEVCHWFMAALFVGWTTYFFYTIWRFHHVKHPKANYHGVKSKASAHLEFTVVLVEAILLFGLGIPLWDKRTASNEWPDKDKALRIHAVGEQFAWNFHYPGPDNVFGKQSIYLVNASNPLGIDWSDPAAKDDIVSKNEMHLIDFKPTVIEITSKDVIHSLSMHPMRMCQDAIPGSKIPMWFRPIKTGVWEIVCAQLCGTGHSQMRALLTVEGQTEYDAWFKDLNDLQHPAAAQAVTLETPVSEFKKLAAGASK